MNYCLTITTAAEEDLNSAFNWYESKRIGLGHDFLLQIDSCFRLIEREPFLFMKQYKDARFYLLKRFPYKVWYYVENKNVIVLAVFYAGRHKTLLTKRVDS